MGDFRLSVNNNNVNCEVLSATPGTRHSLPSWETAQRPFGIRLRENVKKLSHVTEIDVLQAGKTAE